MTPQFCLQRLSEYAERWKVVGGPERQISILKMLKKVPFERFLIHSGEEYQVGCWICEHGL